MQNFWRVKPQGIHPSLSKLIYLNKEEFELLRSLRLCFLKRIKGFFKKEPKIASSVKQSCVSSSARQYPNKSYPDYEASKIQYTRASLLWGWKRVREFYRDLQEGFDNKAIKRTVYNLMYS